MNNVSKNCTRKANKALRMAKKYGIHGKSMTKKQQKTLVNSYVKACKKDPNGSKATSRLKRKGLL